MGRVVTLRARVNGVLENHGPHPRMGQVFSVSLGVLILLNILAVVLSSFDELASWGPWFDGFELFSVSFFSVEYLLRLWTAPERHPGDRHPYLKHTFSFFALIDLLAVLPFYLPLFLPIDLRTLRVLRVFRLVRVFKLGRLFESFELVRRVFVKEKSALTASVLLLGTLLVVASCLMYSVEHDAQPEKFANIVATMWWAVVTLTTVGYGDVFPVTAGGRVLSALISILGIGLVALPTGIISSGFIAGLSKRKVEVPRELFRNLKTGQVYQVIQRARDCTNARDGRPMVVYAPAEGPNTQVFVRDQDEFDVEFVRPGSP